MNAVGVEDAVVATEAVLDPLDAELPQPASASTATVRTASDDLGTGNVSCQLRIGGHVCCV
jgi:hypothetical protein